MYQIIMLCDNYISTELKNILSLLLTIITPIWFTHSYMQPNISPFFFLLDNKIQTLIEAAMCPAEGLSVLPCIS